MAAKIVFQTDRAGMLCGVTEADECQLEPGVWLIPAGCVEAEPPRECPATKWPRWNGHRWELVAKPKQTQPSVMDRIAAAFAAFK